MQKKKYIRYVIIAACIMTAGIGYVRSRQNNQNQEWNLETETTFFENESGKESVKEEQSTTLIVETEAQIYVYVSGAVNQPGVYQGAAGDRVYRFIQMAGGIREDGSEQGLNLARIVTDGEQIYVLTAEQAASQEVIFPKEQEVSNEKEGTKSNKVNLNTADEIQLTTLPGIGSAKAKAIIAYREEKGTFQSIEELMNVQGIKEATFEQIKDLVTV